MEAEVLFILPAALILGHLAFAIGVGYFIRKKKKKDCLGPMLAYIGCSLFSFYVLLSPLFGWRAAVDIVYLSADNSFCMTFFGLFWLLSIFLLIWLLAMLCKETKDSGESLCQPELNKGGDNEAAEK